MSDTSILLYFEYDHLKPTLQAISRPFSVLAHQLADTLPSGPETTVALRKLLESKDAAVRAALPLLDHWMETPDSDMPDVLNYRDTT